MADNVVQFKPEIVGDGYRFEADQVLEGAKGAGFVTMAVIGETEDGEILVFGNANAGETLVLMERSKHIIVFGESGV